MIKVKDGMIEMKGSENEIFTDQVRSARAFCESFAELKGTSTDVMLCCLIEATAEQLDLDIMKITRLLRNRKEAKNDD